MPRLKLYSDWVGMQPCNTLVERLPGAVRGAVVEGAGGEITIPVGQRIVGVELLRFLTRMK